MAYKILVIAFFLFPNLSFANSCNGSNSSNIKEFHNHLNQNGVKLMTWEQWQPSCCKPRYQSQNRKSCSDKALRLVKAQERIDRTVQSEPTNIRGKEEILSNPMRLWTTFCSSGEGAPIDGVRKYFYDSALTLHDAESAGSEGDYFHKKRGFSKKQAYQKANELEQSMMSIFLDNESDRSPLAQDKMLGYSAKFFNRMVLGWSDVGYHYMIGKHSGVVFQGRSLDKRGAHVRRGNHHNMGVSLLGNTRLGGAFPTLQEEAAKKFLSATKSHYDIRTGKILSHNHVQHKFCGSIHINRFLRENFNPNIKDSNRFKDLSKGGQRKRFASIFEAQRRTCQGPRKTEESPNIIQFGISPPADEDADGQPADNSELLFDSLSND